MSTRKQKISFTIKRIKNFWNQYKKSKRGLLGLAIIIFYSIVGIFAPVIATYAPIEPRIPTSEYPGSPGVKIATRLCKPFWYKYLPWIKRGLTNITETFYFYGNIMFGSAIIHFIPENQHPEGGLDFDKAAEFPNYMASSYKVLKLIEIKATPPDGKQLFFNISEWQVRGARLVLPKELVLPANKLLQMCTNATMFKMTYTTGADLVENMKIVKDHKFTTAKSYNEWNWASSSAEFNVQYDNKHGFTTPGREESGCLNITFTGEDTTSEDATIILWKEFYYPYYQPPTDIFIHTSIYKTGSPTITLQLAFIHETEEFTVKTVDIAEPNKYNHIIASEFTQNSTILDSIFSTPGNYKFVVKLKIPAGANTTIYLDYVDCLLYGNIFGWLGTDNAKVYPSDIFSTLVYGTRVSLIVGLLTAVFSTFIGLFLGLVSGYVGGIVDEAIMRFTDLLLVLPTLPLMIVLTVSMRATSGYISMWNIIIIITLFGWMGFARSVRSMVLSLRERAFVEAAKAAGGGRLHIINKHILPNVFALVYITLAMSVPSAIVIEASLSWLGLGDPRLASWGKILYDFNNSGVVTTKGLLDYWFWVFPACLAIATLAAAFVLVGYSLDEILNPRLRERR